MTYPRLVAINWLVLLVAIVASCQAMPSHAGVFIEGQLGASYMVNTAPDGRWRQEAFGSSYNGLAMAYGGRVGYRFAKPWSIQAGLIHFGTNRTESRAVSDACYNDKSHTVHCGEQPMSLKTVSTMNGYTLSGTYYAALSENWSVPLSVGVALVTARLRADDAFQPAFTQERYSRMPMWSVGAGLCWKETICWDNTFYMAIGGQNYHDEVSQQVMTSLVGWRYHF